MSLYCKEQGLFAVSGVRSGQKIPRGACPQGWQLAKLSPTSIDLELVLLGLRALGYYMCREDLGQDLPTR